MAEADQHGQVRACEYERSGFHIIHIDIQVGKLTFRGTATTRQLNQV